MATGLNALELGKLRVSVGYGGHKKGRLLSPIEVAKLLQRMCDAGNTIADCAKIIRIHPTGLMRFRRLLDLPDDLKHLIDWGNSRDRVGFSCATELLHIRRPDDLRAVANAVLEHGLNSKEVRQVAQLLERSNRSVAECVEEVLGMRPTAEKRYVFVGAVVAEGLQTALGRCSQRERDAVLASSMKHIGLQDALGRLGDKIFTLTGGEQFNLSMERIGKESIEVQLCSDIEETLKNGQPHS